MTRHLQGAGNTILLVTLYFNVICRFMSSCEMFGGHLVQSVSREADSPGSRDAMDLVSWPQVHVPML